MLAVASALAGTFAGSLTAQDLNGAGATFPYPIYSKWFADYAAATGVKINGEISAEFLQSIFYPNSPLHDGAVIVRGNRIIAAGCLLPLPEEGLVRERLGTRHRAALGLSLASDALVLVVSEETGAISVIEEGKITRNLDGDSLRRVVSVKVPGPASNGNGFLGRRK